MVDTARRHGPGCWPGRHRAGWARRWPAPTTSAAPGSTARTAGSASPRTPTRPSSGSGSSQPGHRRRRGVGRHRAGRGVPVRRRRRRRFTLERALWDHPHRQEWGAGFGGQAFHTLLPHPTDPQLADRRDLDRRRLPDHRRRRLVGAAQPGHPGGVPARGRSSTPSSGSACTRWPAHPSRPERLYAQNHGGVYRSDDEGGSWTSIADGLPVRLRLPGRRRPARARHRLRLPARRAPTAATRPRARRGSGGPATPATPGRRWRAGDGLPDGFFVGVMRDAMSRRRPRRARALLRRARRQRVRLLRRAAGTWRELVARPPRRDGGAGSPGRVRRGAVRRTPRRSIRRMPERPLQRRTRHQAPQPRRHRRAGEGRGPRHAPRRRHGRRRLGEAADRRRLVVERDHPVQPVARPAREGGQERRARGRRLPARVRHDLGLRRHLDGPRGHALLAGLARGDRRHRRDRDDGRAARRLGAAGRLRQVAARHDDGRRPPRPRLGLPLRRLDHARPGRRPATSRSSTPSRRSARAWPARSAATRSTASSGRSVPGEGACGGMYTANTMAAVGEALGMSLPGSAAPPAVDRRRDGFAHRSGEAVVGMLRQGITARQIMTLRGVRERHRRGDGARRLDQRRAAPARDRPRGRGRPDPRRLHPDRRQGAAPRRPQAVRPLRDERRRQDRRHPGGDEGAARRRPAARRLPDRHRQDDGREPRRHRPARRRRQHHPRARRSRSTPPAASPSSRARWPPRARW